MVLPPSTSLGSLFVSELKLLFDHQRVRVLRDAQERAACDEALSGLHASSYGWRLRKSLLSPVREATDEVCHY